MASHPTPHADGAQPTACTQMIIFNFKSEVNLSNASSPEGEIWAQSLHALQSRAEVRRVYWGSQVENAKSANLHIVRDRLHQHFEFLASPAYTALKGSLQSLTEGDPVVRHANLVEYTPHCESLGKGAPFTGTAIYLGTDRPWDFAWQLWSTIVPKVKGCMGVAGGYIVEPVDGHEKCFIALVGWASLEDHHAYHETKHWRARQAILAQGHKGFTEYHHIAFLNEPLPRL